MTGHLLAALLDVKTATFGQAETSVVILGENSVLYTET